MQLPAHIDMPAPTSSPEFTAFKLVSEDLQRVRALIKEQLIATVPALAGFDLQEHWNRPADAGRLLEYISARSGKMLRPGLVLLAGRCFGKVTEQHIQVAAILEMMHNATLLHDDVMDEGQQRRGLPTVNSVCGNEVAVLLGDFLLSRIFRMCTELETRAAKVVADSAVRLCEGELGQVVRKHNWQLTEPEYIEIITEKSAVLFNSACYLGAVLAKADERHARALAQFGLNSGIAFQITDDLLDLIGDESRTGKTLGTDVEKQKLTLSIIHVLRAVNSSEKKSIINSFLEKKGAQCDRGALVKLLSRYGSLEYARNRAKEFTAEAIKALSDLERSNAKNALIETAEFMISRTT